MEKTMIILFFGGTFASIVFLLIQTFCSPGLIRKEKKKERRTKSETSGKEER